MWNQFNLVRLATAFLTASSMAHPGHEEEERKSLATAGSFADSALSVGRCSGNAEKVARRMEAAIQRHAHTQRLKKRSVDTQGNSLDKRSLESVLGTNHHSRLRGITLDSDPRDFFTTTTCILSPDGGIGPYYVPGEQVRRDITEDEEGVPLYIHVQFIDVHTCDPVPGVYVDVWQANSTGVYSGVQNPVNGNGRDRSNIHNTALRGIQRTDRNGVVMFDSIFPGMYYGRAAHIHVLAHSEATRLPSNTVVSKYASHIGQLFFDQDLVHGIRDIYPYSTNVTDLTLNRDDDFIKMITESSESDPVFKYVLLGDDLADGVFAWITVGIQTTSYYDIDHDFVMTENGGVALNDD
ncbi:dioxygenase [Geosmithia morbida]|uniref:Dioxygenase n=1 Tax=Geosmithia morbida TaxID=1094350 RepID=A0A9P5D394_9HYPO|nr:dioxygenase [Geosmithia morbida]KAF4122311.1 dioxygenase [Geosmithia morbida]